jgi:hypothetical protein
MYTIFSAVQRQLRKSDVMTSFGLTACSAIYYQVPPCMFPILFCLAYGSWGLLLKTTSWHPCTTVERTQKKLLTVIVVDIFCESDIRAWQKRGPMAAVPSLVAFCLQDFTSHFPFAKAMPNWSGLENECPTIFLCQSPRHVKIVSLSSRLCLMTPVHHLLTSKSF